MQYTVKLLLWILNFGPQPQQQWASGTVPDWRLNVSRVLHKSNHTRNKSPDFPLVYPSAPNRKSSADVPVFKWLNTLAQLFTHLNPWWQATLWKQAKTAIFWRKSFFRISSVLQEQPRNRQTKAKTTSRIETWSCTCTALKLKRWQVTVSPIPAVKQLLYNSSSISRWLSTFHMSHECIKGIFLTLSLQPNSASMTTNGCFCLKSSSHTLLLAKKRIISCVSSPTGITCVSRSWQESTKISYFFRLNPKIFPEHLLVYSTRQMSDIFVLSLWRASNTWLFCPASCSCLALEILKGKHKRISEFVASR